MSISEELAEKLLVIANNIVTESEAVEQQTELLQQIRTALVSKTVPGNPGDSGSYDEGYADGQQDVLNAVNIELSGRGLEEVVKLIKAYREKHGEPPAAMMAIYDWQHNRQIEEMKEIKILQSQFRE